jgi:integrase
MATSGWIEDRWLKKRKDLVSGKRERTELWGTSTKRYRVCGIPGVRKRSFVTLDEAKEWKNTTIAAMKKKEFVDERDGEILLGDFITGEWWPKRTDPAGSRPPVKSRVFNHIVDTSLGRTQMYVIGDEHLVEWKQEVKGRGLADTTIEVIWNHLSSVFKSAVHKKRIAKNPCQLAEKGVRPTGPGETKARAWSKEEASAIREAMPLRYRIIADVGMRAGLRQGEAFGFSPDDIDRDRMVLHLRRQLLWENSTHPFFKLPKGNKERDIPLSPGLLKLLDEYGQEFPAVSITLPWKGPGNNNNPTATVSLLVTTALGNRIHPSDFNGRRMKPALAAAGLIAPRDTSRAVLRSKAPGWGWEASREMMHHRWRHTYASVQLGAGEDVISVSHWMGHASPDITLKIYAHFMPDRGLRGRTAVDAWLETDARPRPAAPDLWAVEPLAFTEAASLAIPAERVQEPVEVYVQGSRYAGGPWTVGLVLDAGGPVLGEIRTEPGADADRALASSLEWVREYGAMEGLAIKRAENLSDQVGDSLRSVQALGRFLLVPREGVT